MIHPCDSTMTWLAGLYRMEYGLPYFTVLTREAAEDIRFIHSRMPLILPKNMIPDRISPDSRPENVLPCALTEMTVKRSGMWVDGKPDNIVVL